MRHIRSTILALSLMATPALAAPYTGIYVFGDSLSDNGNAAEALGANFPNPPSYQDSFTNGPVAASILAARLGYTLTPSLWVTNFQDIRFLFGGASYVPGTNYAVAGATAAASAIGGASPLINLPQQVGAYVARSGGVADPNALYVVDIGGNDVRQAALQGTGAAAVASAVQNELGAIGALALVGARNFLVVNVPDIGIIPEFAGTAAAAIATALSQQYDALLAAGLAGLPPTGASTTLFDLYAFNTNLLANAGSYGLTNITTPCYTNTPFTALTTAACGANAQNIASFAYWDQIHPTATVQAQWATGFEAALGVPEPASAAMLGMGLLGLLAARRRYASAR